MENLQEKKFKEEPGSVIPKAVVEILEAIHQQEHDIGTLMNELNSIREIIDQSIGLQSEMVYLERQKKDSNADKPENFIQVLTALLHRTVGNTNEIENIARTVTQLRSLLQREFKP